MKIIKGRYVATVIINFDFPADSPGLKDFDEMRKEVTCEITQNLKELLKDEVDDLGTVEVHQQLADLYEVEVEE